jgi:hypothetical protein
MKKDGKKTEKVVIQQLGDDKINESKSKSRIY